MENKLQTISNLFEGNVVRSIWNSDKEDYYFSVIDVISVLTNANIPRNYWSDLKRKLKQEGSQLHENIVQLKLKNHRFQIVGSLPLIINLIKSIGEKSYE